MGLFDILLIGVGLSMDAAAVTIANVLGDAGIPRRKVFAMAGAFGLFQGLMPVFGFFAGSLFADFISRYAGFVTLVVLGVIGVSMIKESFSHKEESEAPKALTPKILLVQAIATSIDAFAVGVSFCASGADIFTAAPIIAATTFFFSLLAAKLAKRFGHLLGERAEAFGGVILLLIGIKAMFF